MTDMQERLEREAEIMRLDLQLLAYARNRAIPDDDYHRKYVQRNAMIWDYGKTYGTEAQELLRKTLDDAREKLLTRAQELEETAPEAYRIRKLTPWECYRLMGFTDAEFDRIKGVSNTQLYKQAGNSIVVNVLTALFKQLPIG